MTTILHKNLPESELHEPKGISRAIPNTVYKASGNGSGTWSRITPLMLTGNLSSGAVGDYVVMDGAGGFTYRRSGGYASARANVSNGASQIMEWTLDAATPSLFNGVRTEASKLVVEQPGTYAFEFYFGPLATSNALEQTNVTIRNSSTGATQKIVSMTSTGSAIGFLVTIDRETHFDLVLPTESTKRSSYFNFTIRKVSV